MDLLAKQPRSIFLGQAVGCAGTGMTASFANVPRGKLLELPVAEDMQMGMAIGLSLAGELPISVFPRINFLLCAVNQLVSHLDKLPVYSAYKPKVIIRTAVAAVTPLDPGAQHLGDYTEALRMMLKTVKVMPLDAAEQIVPAYRLAMEHDGSTLLVEYARLYGSA